VNKNIEKTKTFRREVLGNPKGLRWANEIVEVWLAQHGLNPRNVRVEFVFGGAGEFEGAPGFGLSEVVTDGSTTKFSARIQTVPTANCYLWGAIIRSKSFKTIYGVIDFPVRHGRLMVDEVVSYILEINPDLWRADGLPVLRRTRKGLMVLQPLTRH
jgi:hypothetical protein